LGNALAHLANISAQIVNRRRPSVRRFDLVRALSPFPFEASAGRTMLIVFLHFLEKA
jgi:hypothetical protein